MEELGRKSVDEFKQSEKTPIIVVLENIRSAYNVGSVFRTSDAFLVEAIYIVGYTSQPPHKEIKKTALGAEESVMWKQFNTTAEAIADLRENGYNVYAVEQAEGSYKLNAISFDADEKIAVIFGNEKAANKAATRAGPDDYDPRRTTHRLHRSEDRAPGHALSAAPPRPA